MFKRWVISCCLLVAFSTLQAHNLIPHYHQETSDEKHGHHHDHGEDDSDKKDTGHEKPFTHLLHSEEFGKTVIILQGINTIHLEPVIAESFPAAYLYHLTAAESPPLFHPPGIESPLHIIFLSRSLPLRAPPACLTA